MYEEGFNTVFVAFGLWFAEIVPPFAVEMNQALGGREASIKAGCWFVLVLLYLMTSWVMRRGWRRFRFLRRRQFPQAAYEGQWLQKVNNERPYGVSCIEYDCAAATWIYRGWAFDADMALKAEWETSSIHYDAALRAWRFAGKGCLVKESGVLLVRENAFDIVVVMPLPAGRDLGTIDAKAADFNFHATTGSHADCIFAVTLTRAIDKRNLVDEVRTMTPGQRRQVFGLSDQTQGPVPALAA